MRRVDRIERAGRRGAAVLLLAMFLAAAQASLGEELYLGASLDWNSRYFWRGMTAHDGPVLQPSVWSSLFGYNLVVWANRPLGEGEGTRGFDEVNVLIEGTSPRQPLSIVPGLNVYTYPHSEEERWTAEVALTFYAPVGPVWLFWENDIDIYSHPGAYYAELGVQGGRDVAENLNLEASLTQGYASVDFNEAYLGVSACSLSFLTTHIGLNWRLLGLLTVSPHLEAVFTVDRTLRRELGSAVRFNYGLTVTLGQD